MLVAILFIGTGWKNAKTTLSGGVETWQTDRPTNGRGASSKVATFDNTISVTLPIYV